MGSADLAALMTLMANQIALRAKELAMREKGRAFTPRARLQWVNTKQRDSIRVILREAFTEARNLTRNEKKDVSIARLELVADSLLEKLQCLHRPRGRPKPRVGLINRPPPGMVAKKNVGRPTAIPREELRILMACVQDVKARRFAREEGFVDDASLYRHIVAHPEDEKEISRAISDTDVLQSLLTSHANLIPKLPHDLSKLKRILKNARRVGIKYQLRPPKSGG